MEITKDTLEQIYTEAFNKAMEANRHRGWQLYDSNGKPYSDTGIGKFYLCGFAYIKYYCNSQQGRDSHKLFKKLGYEPYKAYPAGFEFSLESARGHTNGYYEIMLQGYDAVVDFLNKNGHNVYLDSRLD